MKIEDRDFKGIWIPKEIYLSRDVCWTAKVIFMEIDSFTTSGRSCFFSNDYVSELMGISATQASKHISKLIEIGWIEQTSFDGRKRHLRSTLAYEFKADLKLSSRQPSTEVQGSIEPNFNHNNTVTKPTTKSTKSSLSGDGEKELNRVAKEIIHYLNEKADTSFKTTTKAHLETIRARLNEGHTLEEAKLVIDFKCSQWLNDTKYCAYLRPSTLFSSKNFDNYLQVAKKQERINQVQPTLGLSEREHWLKIQEQNRGKNFFGETVND
jgi:uncharacterized phage protein (TIGR02220 family)